MNVHQLRVMKCPVQFLAGYYWYGQKQHSPGRIPRSLVNLLISATSTITGNTSHDKISEDSTLGIDLLYSEADRSEQGNECEQVDSHKDRHNSHDCIIRLLIT